MSAPTDNTTVDRSRCPATRHGTLGALRHQGCRCLDALDALDARNTYRRNTYANTQPPGRVPALGTHRRIQALRAIGHPVADIAGHMGYSRPGASSLSPLMRRDTVSRSTAQTVMEVYTHLATRPGTCAKTRTWARKAGFPTPADWCGLDMDNPTHHPTGREKTRSEGMSRDRRVSVVGSQRRIHALLAMGHLVTDLARWLGYTSRTSNLSFMTPSAQVMRPELADKVTALYLELRDVPGPHTRQHGWTPNSDWIAPREWIGFDMDNPDHNPRAAEPLPQVKRNEPVVQRRNPDDYTTPDHPIVCQAHPDPDLWHSPDGRQTRRAAAACQLCPALRACLSHALVNDERYGTWGGMTATARERVRKPLVNRLNGTPMVGSSALAVVLDEHAPERNQS